MPELDVSVLIDAPIDRCFDLTRSIEFHEASSTMIGGRAVDGRTSGLAELHDETVWSARFFGLRFRLRTRVVALDPPLRMDEDMVQGLLRRFGHRYELTPLPGQCTRLRDRFRFELPFGRAGRVVERVHLERYLGAVQQTRLEAIRRACVSEEWRAFLTA